MREPLEQYAVSSSKGFMPVAIIGMAFKLPGGAEDSESFWRLLVEKTNTATEWPSDRFNIDGFWHQDTKRENVIRPRQAHFMKGDFRNFDAGFFSMNPREVEAMDPQQRIMLETTYHALENAGLTLNQVAGSKTSVHVGSFCNDFSVMSMRDVDQIQKYAAVGVTGSYLANRVSWFFDLRGESAYVDTACSSGLTAMSHACEALNSGRADMAVASASSLLLIPEMNAALSNMKFLSSSGKCHSFDAAGDGYGRGEGSAVLILKPAIKAIADGDPVRAIVRSIGTNQDGYTAGGITQPSKEMQVQLIRETYRRAGLDMRHTQYFEAHGTGTAVGDPIEAQAIGEAFFKHRARADPTYVGAVKSNIGHLEGASGLAAVAKTILALEKGIIPPNVLLETLNPRVDADFFNLKFPDTCTPWPKCEIRRASVNSFGFGGSNAHVVLEATNDFLRSVCQNISPTSFSWRVLEEGNLSHAVVRTDVVSKHQPGRNSQVCQPKSPRMLIISAADETGIQRQAYRLSQHFSKRGHQEDGQYLQDTVHTFNLRRSQMSWKSYMLLDSLTAFDVGQRVSKPVRRSTAEAAPNLGFVFTGQGAQWPCMASKLLEWPIFRDSILRSQSILDALGCRWNLITELNKHADQTNVHDPEFSQTMSTAVQLGLVDQVSHLRLEPVVVVGHSSGEIAAAYCAGHLCHNSAIKVSYFRGMLASRLAKNSAIKHGMMAVALSDDEFYSAMDRLQEQYSEQVDLRMITVSCLNSSSSVTISGPNTMLDIISQRLASIDVFAKKLSVGVGYHSPQMKEIAFEYGQLMGELQPGMKPRKVKMISSAIPGPVQTTAISSKEYWINNMIHPVRFAEAMRVCRFDAEPDGESKRIDRSHLDETTVQGWLELGPHPALKGYLRDAFQSPSGKDAMFYAPLLARNKPSDRTFLNALGQLYCHNFVYDIDVVTQMDAVNPRTPRILSDLPQYAFNHSVVHWKESARSRMYRFRTQGRNELLGTRSVDWSPLDAKWCHTIKKSQLPWISEHRLEGTMLYPAAGMIVMAIEAMKELLDDRPIVGFEIRDASFITPIVLDESEDGTETQLTMKPVTDQSDGDLEFAFNIYVGRSDDSWGLVCRGTIRADFGRAVQDVDFNTEDSYRLRLSQEAYTEARQSCQEYLDTAKLYERIEANTGLSYGPSFQVLSEIYFNFEGLTHCRLLPSDKANGTDSSATIHPATLDGVFQSSIVALNQGITKPTKTKIPTRVDRIWISATGAGNDKNASEVVNAKMEAQTKRSAIASIKAFSKSDMNILIEVDRLECTEAVEQNDNAEKLTCPKRLCQRLDWKVDLSLLTCSEISEYCHGFRSMECEPEEYYEDLNLMMLSSAIQAGRNLDDEKVPLAPSLAKYWHWVQARINEYLAQDSSGDKRLRLCDKDRLSDLLEKFRSLNQRSMLEVKIAENLAQILRGEIDPLSFIMADEELLSGFYDEVNSAGKAVSMLNAYLDACVHKEPGLRFLEVGAGTGATTRTVLNVISNENGPRLDEYVFTDIGPAFLSSAKKEFAAVRQMKYQRLDIESDISSQGFAEEKFDIIIAANVLHATKDLKNTLQNVRSLLNEDGKLILLEMTTPAKLATGFVFALLEGWWLGCEEFRDESAVVSESRWDELLRDTGFSGVDHIFRDWDSETCHGWSIMISSATPLQRQTPCPGAVPSQAFVLDPYSAYQRHVAENIKASFHQGDRAPVFISFSELTSVGVDTPKNFVILGGLDRALLYNLDSNLLKSLQAIMDSAKSVLFVSNTGSSREPPYWAMIDGLTRVCRGENALLTIVNLSLENATCESADRTALQIKKVLKSMYRGIQTGVLEQEYMEIDGRICINRLLQADDLDEYVFSRTQAVSHVNTFGSRRALKLDIRTPGSLGTLEWIQDPSTDDELGDDEIEMRVQAIGVNTTELQTLLGRADTDALGGECAGYVHRIGSSVIDFKLGDRIVALAAETYRTFARMHQSQAVKIPEETSFAEAAAIPRAFCTAYVSLHLVARIQQGESILIHAAAAEVGQATIQLACRVGAEIFATVDSAEAKNVMMHRYDIPEDHIFYSQDWSFADGIKRMTKGRGVEVIVNSLPGKVLDASWQCIAAFGRFVQIGNIGYGNRRVLSMRPFAKNASFSGVDISAYMAGLAGGRAGNAMNEVFNLAKEGAIKAPHPLESYSLDQTEQVFRLLQSEKSFGKAVLEISDDTLVPIQQGPDSDYRFSPDASYVVAGGLGGLGRQILLWMARRGAKHLLLLSRSKIVDNEQGLKVFSELGARGVNVQHRPCDISDYSSLESCIREMKTLIPPIKGCFQAAMVLHDRPFSTMTHEEWRTCVAPKVDGSWNLHRILPAGMDFFIMLSSVTGIFGNPAQANYAAGNTFQDALARQRAANGESAVSIDLGMILGEGFVAENKAVQDWLRRFNVLLPLSQAEVFSLFDYFCQPQMQSLSTVSSQIITGILLPATIRQAGQIVHPLLQTSLFRGTNQLESNVEPSPHTVSVSAVQNLRADLEAATDFAQAATLVADHLKGQVCNFLGIDADDRTVQDRMDSFGIDSLVALRLRNWLAQEARADMAIFEIMGDTRLIDVGTVAVRKSQFAKAEWREGLQG